MSYIIRSHTSGRAVKGEGPQPIICWVGGFESRQRHGCPSFVSVVCCQVQFSVTGQSHVQMSHADCVSFCFIPRNLKNEAALARDGLLPQTARARTHTHTRQNKQKLFSYTALTDWFPGVPNEVNKLGKVRTT